LSGGLRQINRIFAASLQNKPPDILSNSIPAFNFAPGHIHRRNRDNSRVFSLDSGGNIDFRKENKSESDDRIEPAISLSQIENTAHNCMKQA
jgi:hypothetical protein